MSLNLATFSALQKNGMPSQEKLARSLNTPTRLAAPTLVVKSSHQGSCYDNDREQPNVFTGVFYYCSIQHV